MAFQLFEVFHFFYVFRWCCTSMSWASSPCTLHNLICYLIQVWACTCRSKVLVWFTNNYEQIHPSPHALVFLLMFFIYFYENWSLCLVYSAISCVITFGFYPSQTMHIYFPCPWHVIDLFQNSIPQHRKYRLNFCSF